MIDVDIGTVGCSVSGFTTAKNVLAYAFRPAWCGDDVELIDETMTESCLKDHAVEFELQTQTFTQCWSTVRPCRKPSRNSRCCVFERFRCDRIVQVTSQQLRDSTCRHCLS